MALDRKGAVQSVCVMMNSRRRLRCSSPVCGFRLSIVDASSVTPLVNERRLPFRKEQAPITECMLAIFDQGSSSTSPGRDAAAPGVAIHLAARIL